MCFPKYCDGFAWHCEKKIFVRAYTQPKLLPESFGYTIIIDNFVVLLIMSITSWFNRDLFYHGQFFSTVYEFYASQVCHNPKFAMCCFLILCNTPRIECLFLKYSGHCHQIINLTVTISTLYISDPIF